MNKIEKYVGTNGFNFLVFSRIFFSPPNGIRKNSCCPTGVTNTVCTHPLKQPVSASWE